MDDLKGRPPAAAALADIDAMHVHARRRAAEQLVREQVMVQTFADLPAPSLRQKLAAAHYELSSSASPVAIVRALRP